MLCSIPGTLLPWYCFFFLGLFGLKTGQCPWLVSLGIAGKPPLPGTEQTCCCFCILARAEVNHIIFLSLPAEKNIWLWNWDFSHALCSVCLMFPLLAYLHDTGWLGRALIFLVLTVGGGWFWGRPPNSGVSFWRTPYWVKKPEKGLAQVEGWPKRTFCLNRTRKQKKTKGSFGHICSIVHNTWVQRDPVPAGARCYTRPFPTLLVIKFVFSQDS